MSSRSLDATAALLGVAATILGAACYAGCEAVPDIRFVSDDAASDAASIHDASASDADTSDAEPVSCTGASPSTGATCCGGLIWCEGQCGAVNCAVCADKLDSGTQCQPGDVCCGKNGTAVCKPQCP